MSEGSERASDAEREDAAERLRVAAAEGRLDPDELDERVGHVYGARTRGELATITRDLPEPTPGPAPPKSRWEDVRETAAGLLIPNLICNAVWLATGSTDWWPKWVLPGTGIAFIVKFVRAGVGIEDDGDDDKKLPRPPAPPELPA